MCPKGTFASEGVHLQLTIEGKIYLYIYYFQILQKYKSYIINAVDICYFTLAFLSWEILGVQYMLICQNAEWAHGQRKVKNP